MTTKLQTETRDKGAIMLVITLLFIVVFTTIVFGIVTPVITQIANGMRMEMSRSSYYLAEAGVEDVIFRLKNGMDVSSVETLALDGQSVETTITDNVNSKTVKSVADYRDHIRKVETRVILGEGVSFSYALQAGAGGFDITGGSTVNGNVYANGPITGGGGSEIDGAATSAFFDAPAELYVNDTPVPPSDTITFGDSNDTQDIAQSFTADADSSIESVSLYLRKTNYPSDLTIRITPDNGGQPKKQSLATASLPAYTVTNSFDWYELMLDDSVSLTSGQTYWVVLDGPTNSCSQYYCDSYEIGSNEAFPDEKAMRGRYNNNSWNDTNPAGKDMYAQIYAGGIPSEIAGSGNYVGSIVVSDRAWAKSVRNASIGGELWCDTATMVNKACDTSHPNPSPQNFPISDSDINSWKDDAESGGVYTGNLSVGWAGTTTGPLKIDGDLDIGGGGTLTLTGTVWVTGDVTVTGGGKVTLHSSYGDNSGVLVSDGEVSISGGGQFTGSGQAGSYPIVVTTSVCPADDACGGDDALEITGGSGAVLLIAQNGTLNMNGGTGARAMSGYQITISGGGEVTYESGLADITLSSDPDGGWNVKSWEEVE